MNALKARWLVLAAKVDALSQRERVLSFAAAAALVVFGAQAALLGPMARKEATLRDQVAKQRDAVKGIERAIADQAAAFAIDPDRPLRERLQGVDHEAARLQDKLRTMERGVVPPERVAPLLETILRNNGRLKLVSMKTLPVTPLRDPQADPAAATPAAPAAATAPAKVDDGAAMAQNMIARAVVQQPGAQQPQGVQPPGQPALQPAVQPGSPAAAPAAPEPDLLFRHGVELTVRGSYLDLVDYMNTLESLPTQLFWGKAQLEVEEYPAVRLTLTLYTLSLDTKWMKL